MKIVKENIEEAKRREANLFKKLMEDGIPDEKLVRLIAPSQVHKYKEEVVKRLLEEFKEGIPDKKTIEEIKERFGEEVTKELVNKVIETLLVKINSEDWEERMEACAALGDLGVKSKKVINALLERLKDGSELPYVKKAVAEALGKIAKKNKMEEEIVERILPGINSRNPEERYEVCLALGELGIASKEVMDALIGRLKDENEKWDVKKAVAEALVKIRRENWE